MSTTERYTLGKTERLKSRKEIDAVFKEGKAFSTFPLRVVFLIRQQELERQINGTEVKREKLQAGFTVSTKHFKKAVDRNKVKRLMREAYRLQKNELKNNVEASGLYLYVFFIYTGNEIPGYTLIADKTGKALKRLINICNEGFNGDT